MATKYADRAFLRVNGSRLADLESSSLKQNFNAKAVPTMTPDQFNRGFVKGNTDIDITWVMAVQNLKPRPKIESLDFENNDISIVFEVGQEQFVATGIFPKDATDDASGVGTEVKSTQNYGALKVVDATGSPVDFNLQLG